MKPYLGDQLGRDEGWDEKVDFAPEGEEPLINCWIEVKFRTLKGPEELHYMYVSGAYVRDHLFVDFCEGGHYYRYGWIPEDQIWIEDEMSVIDQVCTAFHETHERYRMKYLGEDYETAHDSACVIERKVRQALLAENITSPHAEDLGDALEMEGSGEDSFKFFMKLLKEHEGLVEDANYQANHAEGSREG
jgi:hypothetical protein